MAPTDPDSPVRLPAPLWAGYAREPGYHHPARHPVLGGDGSPRGGRTGRVPGEPRSVVGERAAQGRIVEGHGDLRPEHIFLDGTPRIIDCLEFDRDLRLLDPVDELAFLALECERLGAPWICEEVLTEPTVRKAGTRRTHAFKPSTAAFAPACGHGSRLSGWITRRGAARGLAGPCRDVSLRLGRDRLAGPVALNRPGGR